MRPLLLLAALPLAALLDAPPPTPHVRGDADRSGGLGASDALMVLTHVVGGNVPEGASPVPHGDADCGGSVTARDALIILTRVVEGDVSAYCVGEPVVAALALAPDPIEVAPGETSTVTLSLLDPDGAGVTGARVEWSTGDTAVAGVDASGVVTGGSVGSTTLTATSQGRSASVGVVVRASTRLPVESRFEVDNEGWTFFADAHGLSGEGSPTHVADGGHPGGYIAGLDIGTGQTWYFRAPASFHGDLSGAYGHALTYALRRSGSGSAFENAEVVLTGGGLTLMADHPHPGTDWTSFAVPLHESAWQQGGGPATAGQLHQALSDVTELRIRAEYLNAGGDRGDLDEVTFGVPVGAVTVGPSGAELHEPGETIPLGVTVTEAGGAVLDGALVTWRSSDSTVATVDDNGVVTAMSTGVATVTASFGAASGSAVVVVEIPPLPLPLASDFEDGPQGWFIWSGGPTYGIDHMAVGNPGGNVSKGDPDSNTWFFQSPPSWEGDGEAAYGAFLLYDLRQSSTASQFEAAEVELFGVHGTLRWDGPHPGTTWTPYQIPLDVTGGWTVGGVAASEDRIRSALRTFRYLRIRGEYVVGSDRGYLDNVLVGVRPAVTAAPGSLSLPGAGSTGQLSAEVRDQRGELLPGSPRVAWSTSDPLVATVDADGLVTGQGVGTAVVTVSFAGVSAEVPVQVLGAVEVIGLADAESRRAREEMAGGAAGRTVREGPGRSRGSPRWPGVTGPGTR